MNLQPALQRAPARPGQLLDLFEGPGIAERIDDRGEKIVEV
jgi:hypothetical protein